MEVDGLAAFCQELKGRKRGGDQRVKDLLALSNADVAGLAGSVKHRRHREWCTVAHSVAATLAFAGLATGQNQETQLVTEDHAGVPLSSDLLSNDLSELVRVAQGKSPSASPTLHGLQALSHVLSELATRLAALSSRGQLLPPLAEDVRLDDISLQHMAKELASCFRVRKSGAIDLEKSVLEMIPALEACASQAAARRSQDAPTALLTPGDFEKERAKLNEEAAKRHAATAKQLHTDRSQRWKPLHDFFSVIQSVQIKADSLRTRLARLNKEFEQANEANVPPFAASWKQALESAPKRQKKEYTGHARAEKEELDRRRVSHVDDFVGGYLKSLLDVDDAWMRSNLVPALAQTSELAEDMVVAAMKPLRISNDKAQDVRHELDKQREAFMTECQARRDGLKAEIDRCREEWSAASSFADKTSLAESPSFRQHMERLRSKAAEGRAEDQKHLVKLLQFGAPASHLASAAGAVCDQLMREDDGEVSTKRQAMAQAQQDLEDRAKKLVTAYASSVSFGLETVLVLCATEVLRKLKMAYERHLAGERQAEILEQELAASAEMPEHVVKLQQQQAAKEEDKKKKKKKKKHRKRTKSQQQQQEMQQGHPSQQSTSAGDGDEHDEEDGTDTDVDSDSGEAEHSSDKTTPSSSSSAHSVPKPPSAAGSSQQPVSAGLSAAQLEKLRALPQSNLIDIIAMMHKEQQTLRHQLRLSQARFKAAAQQLQDRTDRLTAVQQQWQEVKNAVQQVAVQAALPLNIIQDVGQLSQPGASASQTAALDDAAMFEPLPPLDDDIDPALLQMMDAVAISEQYGNTDAEQSPAQDGSSAQ